MIRHFLLPAIFVSVLLIAVCFSLGHFPAKGTSFLDVQRERFQTMRPDGPEYRAFFNNRLMFYRKENESLRERLRQIQQKIESDPQAQTLKLELKTYHAWLKTISQADKAKIDQAKTIEDRLNVIRDIKANQDRIQGTLDQQPARNFRDHEIVNLYPTVPELAEFLESLDPERLEILLGHTPSNFLYQLEKEYRDEAEEKTK